MKLMRRLLIYSDEIVKYAGFGVQLPRIPGHEIVGEVVAIAPGEKAWQLGQRVGSGWHGGECKICTSCTSGDFIACEKADINGIWRDGGYAQYVTLRSEALTLVPEDLDPAEVAPLFCAGVTVFNSIRNMGLRAGDVVAVQGIG
jgi:D-arabinose 1-dehydrogenase-like Zn-dependent alcohol dehydrogenase